MFEGICEAIHREMDALEEKYESGTAMNSADLDHIDKMAHALKSLATYEAMKTGYECDNGSYAKIRSRTGGRYRF